ncbi:isoprenoid synthase domain-containing protein [Dipodascopsis tothii]|uniref:isoprenoid synthase domain-containing protein n=1 Tax=Dipodascopsis tothii TaxID=44089 RepID=UPI0034CDB428
MTEGESSMAQARAETPAESGAVGWSARNESIVLGPYTYLTEHPGKDIRQLFMDAFNHWLQVPERSLEIINRAVSMLHTASLLVDDVEDNANLRRGHPVAHSVFGVAQTINSSNYVYFLALQELALLGNAEVYKIYAEEMINLHRGQGLDLYWRDTLTVPSEEEYVAMVQNKTGGLFRLAIKLMQSESAVKLDFVPLANLIGVLYQIRDDYLNLQSDQYSKNKGYCEDLTEGKFSFPIIHSIRANSNNDQLLNILKQHTADRLIKNYAVSYMRDTTHSFAYTEQVMAGYAAQVKAEIERLQVAPNPLLDGIFKGILE